MKPMSTRSASIFALFMGICIFVIHVSISFDSLNKKLYSQQFILWSIYTKDNTEDPLLCPRKSARLVGNLKPVLEPSSSNTLREMFPWVKEGGWYTPKECKARHHVAIIIPYRDRDSHLRIFLRNIHPFLKRQQLEYGIFIIEQVGNSNFNRAMLMNIGYMEALKIHNFTCFIFHDVDLIPEDDRNYYTCSAQPKHLSVAIDKFEYRLPYKAIFGGASALSGEQFTKVNGFSNKFFGWGGEDDDMWNRLKHAKYKVTRYSSTIARYKMLKHNIDKTNKRNNNRFKLLRNGYKRYDRDGLNSLKYTVKKVQLTPLYTKISVDINEREIMKER